MKDIAKDRKSSTEAPSTREFDEVVADARKSARLAGLRKFDIAEAIRAV